MLPIAIGLGCEEHSAPPVSKAPDAAPAVASPKTPEPPTATPRQRDVPVTNPKRAELAFIAEGAAQLALFAQGPGPLAVTIEREGVPIESLRLEVPEERRTPVVIPLGEGGARPIGVKVTAPAATTLDRALLRDLVPPPPSAPMLAASLRGRSLFLVVCDALNADHLHCYGAARATSPNIDALAAEGVRFERARSQSAWTVPSITTVMTGLEQERHALRDVGIRLAADVPTLAEAFRAAGYATAAFVQNKLLTKETGLDRGFELWQEYPGEAKAQLLPALAKYLDEAAKPVSGAGVSGRPLFTYIHLLAPHAPYQPPAEFATKFGAADAAIDGSVDLLARMIRLTLKADDPQIAQLAALYDNNVAFGDSLVGEVRRLVRDPQQSAILFLSDHGEEFWQHGTLGHNVHVYDEMVHVPLIVWAPGSKLPAGRVVREPVALSDLWPTLAELCGIGGNDEHPGRSFAGLIETTSEESQAPHVTRLSSRYFDGQPGQRAVAFGPFKLVAPALGKANALFDLTADPNETADVTAAHPLLATALRGELSLFASEELVKPSGPGFKPDAELQKELRELGYAGADGK